MGMKATASRLIRQRGQPATLLRPGPATKTRFGVTTPGPATEHACWAFVARFADEARLWGQGSGWLTEGDIRILVSTEGLTIEPTTFDSLLIGEVEHEIRRVAPLAPAGEIIFWEIQARSE